MMACSLVLHRMNTLTTNCKLVATCASTYTPHTTSLDLHIETHIQVLLCDQCSDEAMPVCITCVAYGVIAYLYKQMFNCRRIGPSCQAQLRDTPMPRPGYIDFFHSRIRRSILGVAKQPTLPEPQRLSGPAVFWEPRTIIDSLGFTGSLRSLHKWWGSFEEVHVGLALERAGLDITDVRVPLETAQSRAKEKKEPPPAVGFYMQEYVAFTEGIVVLLCR